MKKGFTLIEIMTVLGIVIILAVVAFQNLGGFSRKRSLDSTIQSMTVFLRDAQQRSINQESNRYWGVRFENLSTEDSYSLFNATDTLLSGLTVVRKVLLKSSLDFITPPVNSNITVLFDKISGRALLSGCPSPTVSSVIELTLLSGASNATITTYCNGRIEL